MLIAAMSFLCGVSSLLERLWPYLRSLNEIAEKGAVGKPQMITGIRFVNTIQRHDETTRSDKLFKTENETLKTICIEGNIGCGKTTLLNYFKNRYNKVFAEPVDMWRNVDGENLFHYLYKDPARYSLAFQTYVQLTMIQLHQKRPKLMERSIYSARFCFVENLYKLNYLSRLEYVVLDKWFKHLVNGDDNDANLNKPKQVQIDLIIYLRCCPKNVMERIKLRSRAEERGITYDYVKNVHDLHEDWLMRGKFPVPSPVLVIDTNCPQNELEKLYEKVAPYISGEKIIKESPTIISLNE